MNKITDWTKGYMYEELPIPDTSELIQNNADLHIECPYCHETETTQHYLHHGWYCLSCHHSFYFTFIRCPACRKHIQSGVCNTCNMEFSKEEIENDYALTPEENYHNRWG